ncbi:MAG: hypothetical protein ACLGSD_06095 [Acidobacteriota bacterium]
MLFSTPTPDAVSSRKRRWRGWVAAFALISAATAVMMLCPCDVVGMHDYKAISLVALAGSFGVAAAAIVHRSILRNLETTEFLRAVVALALVGIGIWIELFLAMEAVALIARVR